MDTRFALLAAAVALTLAACSTPQSRVSHDRADFDASPPAVQEKIGKGQIDVGFSPAQVQLALGKPDRKYSQKTAGANDQEVWVYYAHGAHPGVGVGLGFFSGGGPVATGISVGSGGPVEEEPSTRVVFEKGAVVSIEKPK